MLSHRMLRTQLLCLLLVAGGVVHGIKPSHVPFMGLQLRLRGGAENELTRSASFHPEGFLDRVPLEQIWASGASSVGSEVVVCGWAKTVRIQGAGSFAFMELNDGTSFKNLQVVADKGIQGWDALAEHAHTHTSWRVEGMLVASPGKEQAVECRAIALTLLGSCSPTEYPLAKGRLPLDFLRGIPHLRARTNTLSSITRLRSRLAFAIHSFFQERGFHHVHTPVITTSDCEGAGELFSVSTLLARQDIARNVSQNDLDYGQDFFKQRAYLSVSGQLQAEAMAMAMGKVYTFGPTFRAEESHTTRATLKRSGQHVRALMGVGRHLAEFWMVEPEIAFANLQDAMGCAEALLRHCVAFVLRELPDDVAFFHAAANKGLAGFAKGDLRGKLEGVLKAEFVRVSYTEAIETLRSSKRKFDPPAEWGSDLSTAHERFLTEEAYHGPVIVYDYPSKIKPFYMRLNDDNNTVAAMDVLFPKCGEIVGGSQREDRYHRLRARAAQHGIPTRDLQWYADLRRFGGAPHAGFGLGFERLLMFVSGLENIRDVSSFPRFPGHALG